MQHELQSQSQPTIFQLEWSQERFNEIKNQLKGYWEKDIWSPHDNPFKDENKDNNKNGSYLRFEGCPETIKAEIQFACYQMIINKHWSVDTLHYNASKINIICQWLQVEHSQSTSIVVNSLDKWLLSLRTYLIKIKKYSGKRLNIRGHVNKNGEKQSYIAEHDCIYKFTQIYNYIFDCYDNRDEYEKDIWDLKKLGFTDKYVSASRQHTLDFTELKGSWLYAASQKFLKYKLPLISSTSCCHKLLAIRKFLVFLNQRHPSIRSSEINRSIILDYLGYLTTLEIGSCYHHSLIASLRDFLEISYRENWLEITGNKLIYDDDLPKYKRKNNPDYIPEEVVNQILQHLSKIKNPVCQRMFSILIECGMRISEICHLKFDCLKQTSKEEYYLLYHQFKFKKDHTIPVSKEVVKAVREQQNYVRSQVGKDCPYLFPSKKHKAQYKAISHRPLCNEIRLLIHQEDIRDNNGIVWQFHSHQCRHTVGTQMINNGVPQHIVQRYLGHESPTMTMVYAHIHDETLRKEIEKYHESTPVNFQGEAVELEETILSSSNDLEWFTKNVQPRALEHGYCGRPRLLGDCDIPGFDGCYNCPHWRTNKSFLPILQDTLDRTNKVLEKARMAGWELQVKKNEPIKHNLEKVIKSLEADSHE